MEYRRPKRWAGPGPEHVCEPGALFPGQRRADLPLVRCSRDQQAFAFPFRYQADRANPSARDPLARCFPGLVEV